MLRAVNDDGLCPEDEAYARGVVDGSRERDDGPDPRDDRRRPPWWVVAVVMCAALFVAAVVFYVAAVNRAAIQPPASHEMNQRQDVEQDVGGGPAQTPSTAPPSVAPTADEPAPTSPAVEIEPRPLPEPVRTTQPEPVAPVEVDDEVAPAAPAEEQPAAPVVPEPVPTVTTQTDGEQADTERPTPVRDALCQLLQC